MAYQSRDLSILARAIRFTLWHYTTADALAEVESVGYFTADADTLRVGDVLIVNATLDGKTGGAILHVCGNEAGVVDVENVTPGGLLAFAHLRPVAEIAP